MNRRFDILTIGHSNHAVATFCDRLAENGVRTVVDVRTTPFSRFQPQFSSRAFAASLQGRGLSYIWRGRELGGRPAEDRLYARDGSADYVAMAREPMFGVAIAEVIDFATKGPVCLVCSEREPLECHRCLMVGRALVDKGTSIGHIHFDGKVESQSLLEDRLLRKVGAPSEDLFAVGGDRLGQAYIDQARKIAFRKPDSMSRNKGLQPDHEAGKERGNDDLGDAGPAHGR